MSANYFCLGSAPYPASPIVRDIGADVGRKFAAAVGAANALPAVVPRDHLVSADYDGIENVWWRRRYWRRWYWRRW
jgi:hypothetical protein